MIKINKPPAKYECSVYDQPEKRFQIDGCWNSWKIGIDYCAFPGSRLELHKGFVAEEYQFWNPVRCSDGKMRPVGLEDCTYIWNEELLIYEGECTQCGACCEGCKYLVKVKDDK